MTPDWSALAPHRPVAAGRSQYVAPPSNAGEEIANRVMAGAGTILVGGPAGIGKSTELDRAAALLRGRGRRIALLIPIDTWENMRRVTPDRLLLRIAGQCARVASQNLGMSLNQELLAALWQAGVLPSSVLTGGAAGVYEATPRALATAVLGEVARLSKLGPVTLLIDGMEKVPEGPTGTELFDALANLPEHVEQVVVMPWHAAYGPHSETVIRPGEKWMILSPDRVEGNAGARARAFLREILARRLSIDATWLDPEPSAARVASRAMGDDIPPTAFAALVDDAAVWSGGIPRVFLQLVADAGTYARLRRDEDWPKDVDLVDAVADLEDSFRRALLPGDTEACRQAEGTDGRELELGRKIRLLARGVLVERRDDRRTVLEIHPLARRPLEEAFPRA
jgi:hypothetical protein